MRRSPGVLAVALVLALPASADAVTRYVLVGGQDNTNCAISTKPCATINHAVKESTSGDTIQIGVGTYTETVATKNVLTFAGAGMDAVSGTTVQGPNGIAAPGSPAFHLPNGGTLRSLNALGGDGADAETMFGSGQEGGAGVDFTAADGAKLEIEGALAGGGDGGSGFPLPAAGGPGLLMEGLVGKSTLSSVDGEFGGGGGLIPGSAALITGPAAHAELVRSTLQVFGTYLLPSPALWIDGGAQANLDMTNANGPMGAAVTDGSLSMTHSFVASVAYPAVLVQTAPAKPVAHATATDSIFYSNEAEAAAVESVTGGVDASLVAHGTTMLSVTGGGGAVVARGSVARVTMRNSIARQEPKGEVPHIDLRADGGTISAQFSNFTTFMEENGGTLPEPGIGSNVAGDPQFRQPQPVGSIRLDPLETSPVIDRGDPGLVFAGELDFGGQPRSLDSNGDCVAAPDLGAFELTGQSAACPPIAISDAVPLVSGFGVTNKKFAPKGSSKPMAKASLKRPKKGTKFLYTLSERAKVKITIERRKAGKGKKVKPRFAKVTTLSAQEQSGRQSTPFSGRVKGKPLKPGKYRAQITATDAAGQISAPQKLSFKIVSG